MRVFIPGNIYENPEKMREIQSAEWGGGGRGQSRSCEGLVHISHPCHAIDGEVRGGGEGGEQTVQAIDSSRLAVSVYSLAIMYFRLVFRVSFEKCLKLDRCNDKMSVVLMFSRTDQ
jgi:hypothetical protein